METRELKNTKHKTMNIAEILKCCFIGTKLYSLVDGEVFLEKVESTGHYPIEVVANDGNTRYFTKDGLLFSNRPNGECVLFPSKEQRDWNKFRLPVKKGDIMMIIDGTCPFIATGEWHNDILPKYICGINSIGEFQKSLNEKGWTSMFYIPASKEAKKELFDKIAEAGYKWNTDTLELEKIEPKFEEGDIIELDNVLYLTTGIIKNNKLQTCCLMQETTINVYEPEFNDGLINIAILATKEKRNKFYSALIRYGYRYDKKQHKLIKQKFKPFDKVLVRDNTKEKWSINIFSYLDEEWKEFPYNCLNAHYRYCIPYESNEHLAGSIINPLNLFL